MLPFKLKYLNQKVFFFIPYWKNITFFSWEHRVYILMGFKSHIWKKTPGPRSPGSRVDPPGWPCLARSLHQSVFWQTWTDPAPGSWVDPPGQAGFNNYGLNSFSSYNIYKNALGLSINNKKEKGLPPLI